MHYRLLNRRLLCMSLLIAAVTNGADLQIPSVTLDGNPETEGISPVTTSVIPGEKLLVAITGSQVLNMHSYSVKCAFDTEVVAFEGAVAKLSPFTPAFLESNNGKIAAFLSIPGNGFVEIAATQTGKDPASSVSGSGILGYLSFSSKKSGNPRIIITEARIVDPEGTVSPAILP